MTTDTNHKINPSYAWWRKRIEGQIRHTINEHPEWFNLPDDKDRPVRSMAKRIIGQIIAATEGGDNPAGSVQTRVRPAEDDSVQIAGAESGGGAISSATPNYKTGEVAASDIYALCQSKDNGHYELGFRDGVDAAINAIRGKNHG